MTVATASTNRSADTSTPQVAKPRRVVVASVVRRERLSPSYARVTLAGSGLREFEHKGHDQWFRMFIPRRDQGPAVLPDADTAVTWYGGFSRIPADVRPDMRYVTVRDFRRLGADGPEMDVDVVLHGDPGADDCGPLSVWAQTAEPGDRVGILDQGLVYRPELAGAAGVLLVGDETAVPAIAGILRSLPAGTQGRALIEVPYVADVQELGGPADVSVAWFARDRTRGTPGSLVREKAVATLHALAGDVDDPADLPYVYAAGESRMTAALAQTLKRDLGWPKERLTTVGYWHYTGEDAE